MTMPQERTLALMWAAELLRFLRDSDSVPDDIRASALVIARHYLAAAEIASAVKTPDSLKAWLAPTPVVDPRTTLSPLPNRSI